MRGCYQITPLLAGLLLVILGRHTLPSLLAQQSPTGATEGSVTAILFGDARRLVSQALLERIDTYFHGGVRATDCGGIHDDADKAADHVHDQTEQHAAAEHHHHHTHHHHTATAWSWRAPWRQLQQQLRVQLHRHLAEEEFNELLPWVWAACRAAPENIQAYQIGSYVLWRYTNDPAPAMRLLHEGLVANPESYELAFDLAEYYLNRMGDSAAAEEWFRRAYDWNRLDKRATEEAKIIKLRTLLYLGHLAWQQGARDTIAELLHEAQQINPKHTAVTALQTLLAKPFEHDTGSR